jgi:hypothetical protein
MSPHDPGGALEYTLNFKVSLVVLSPEDS